MSKHTPGKWIANAKHCACANGAEIVIEQEYGSAPIAKAFQIYGDQLQANASLIAAAPELLDVLEALRRECEGDSLGTVKAPSWTTVCKAAAIIARATGK